MNRVENLTKSWGEVKVLDGVTAAFPANQITVLLGPSGCGKTTLLHILAGLQSADGGSVAVTSPISYIFQEPRLLPWLSVHDNVALVLADKLAEPAIKAAVDQALAAVGILDYARYYPNQLSGGLKQRVALARAFAYPAPCLLMDEPFKSLDLKNRYQLMADFIKLWRKQPRTVMLVTHDVQEALWLGDQIVVLTDKPTRVAKRFGITSSPQEERMGDERLWQVEKELLGLLLT